MTVHLIHAPLNMRKFSRWAGSRGLIRRGSFDAGYAFHVLLSAMFGKGVLQPFRLFASERRARRGALRLRGRRLMRSCAIRPTPSLLQTAWRCSIPERMRSKPYAGSLRTGAASRLRIFGFGPCVGCATISRTHSLAAPCPRVRRWTPFE